MREKIPQSQVLEFLQANHPDLHESAEIDREWVWITANLKGDEHKPVRDAINDYGFRFSRLGHETPSGKTAHWGHSCMKPLPFRRKRKSGQSSKPDNEQQQPQQDVDLAEAAAFFGV